MCQARASQKCTGAHDVRLSDGSNACAECERALHADTHQREINTSERERALKKSDERPMPQTTPMPALG